MKSPFTGGTCTLKHEMREVTYRKETYKYMAQYWVCDDTQEEFTTTEQDGASIAQVYNQYRSKYGIPFPDEIRATREQYGLSAIKMSQLLGMGDNQYRLYENGEVPNLSNGRMLRSISNPKVMLDLVKSCQNIISEREFYRITKHLQSLIAQSDLYRIQQYEETRIFPPCRNEDNGFASLSLPRLQNLLLLILNKCGNVWVTKMNKLLFYIDFASYRDYGMAITGLTYRAIDYGPVPEKWDRVYSQFDSIRQEPRSIGDYDGCVLLTDQKADETLFSEQEIKVINHVCETFKNSSSRDLSAISHLEDAWALNHENAQRIPFLQAFTLKAV